MSIFFNFGENMNKLVLVLLSGLLGNSWAQTESAIPTAQNQQLSTALCSSNGGSVSVEHNGAGKEYQVCFFSDNRQCELSALNNKTCPIGGLKITGYDTPAQVYCAIQGGKVFAVESAICTLPNGNKILAEKYYNMK